MLVLFFSIHLFFANFQVHAILKVTFFVAHIGFCVSFPIASWVTYVPLSVFSRHVRVTRMFCISRSQKVFVVVSKV